MENKLPKRKKNRLEKHDYSSYGAYFLTICTAKRCNYFWDNVFDFLQELTENNMGASDVSPQDVKLSEYGKIVEESINNLSEKYPTITVEHYVIMLDHVHVLLSIHAHEHGQAILAPTMSRVVQQMKGYVTKRVGHTIWQKSFFDHVIRNTQDYEEHVRYIYENPMKFFYNDVFSKETLNDK